jgi:hypothetical protein
MALDGNKIKKVLTHDFVTGSSIQNFDDIIDYLFEYIHDEINVEQFIYNGKPTFKNKTVTNLTINVKRNISDNGWVYPKPISLLGYTLGNQSLNLIGVDFNIKEETENERRHAEYTMQIYNPTEVDISSDVSLHLTTLGFYH